jgi:hypothetical protein
VSSYTGAFWLLISLCCELASGSDAQLTSVFAAGILVGLAVFKDDWDTQRVKAEDFLGGAHV